MGALGGGGGGRRRRRRDWPGRGRRITDQSRKLKTWPPESLGPAWLLHRSVNLLAVPCLSGCVYVNPHFVLTDPPHFLSGEFYPLVFPIEFD